MALRQLRTLHNVPTCQLSLKNKLYMFVVSVCMHSETTNLIWYHVQNIYCFAIPWIHKSYTDLAAIYLTTILAYWLWWLVSMSIVKNKRKCQMTIRSAIKTSLREKKVSPYSHQVERVTLHPTKWPHHWLCCEVLCNLRCWQRCEAGQVSGDNRWHHWWSYSKHWVCLSSGSCQLQWNRSIQWIHHTWR